MARTPYECIKYFIESNYAKQLEERSWNAIDLTKHLIDTFELDRTQPMYGTGRNAQQVYRHKEMGMSSKSYKSYYDAYLRYKQSAFQSGKPINTDTTSINLSEYIHKEEIEAKFFEWAKSFCSEPEGKGINDIVSEVPMMGDIEFMAKALIGEIKDSSSEILKLIFKICYQSQPNTTKGFQSFSIGIRQDLNMVSLTMKEVELFQRNNAAILAGADHNKVNEEHLEATVFENNMTKFHYYYKRYVELGKILFKDKKRFQCFIYYITH